MTKKSKVIIFFTILFALIAILLVGGQFYFNDHLLIGTKFHDKDVSFLEYSKIPELLEGHDFEISGRDEKKKKFKKSELGFSEDFENINQLEENRGFWLVDIFSPDNLADYLVKKVDEEKLRETFEKSSFVTEMEEPENAKIEIKDDEIFLVPEEEGSTLILDESLEEIKEAFLAGEPKVILTSYEEPVILTTDLQEKYDDLQEYMNLDLKIQISGDEEDLPKASRFLVFNEEEGDYSFHLEGIQEYVMELKERVDNLGKARTFKTFYGDEIEVSGGTFGMQMNRDKTSDKILQALVEKSEEVIEPVFTHESMNNGEIGDDYIELSLKNQRMWLVKNGEVIVDTPVVTGNVAQGYATPRGVFEVWVKHQDRYLRGKNFDGTDYKVPVKYWMQVDYTGIGIHDTYYRSSYGGSIYYYNGSHGCINTPLNKVRTMYENTEMGTPMIIY